MTRTALWALTLAAVVAATAYVVAPSLATPPTLRSVEIVLTGTVTGPDSVAGTWTSSGAISDHGSYVETFSFEGSTIRGIKTLTGAHGTITLKVEAEVVATSPTTIAFEHGFWKIVAGTGAYARLKGGGSSATDPGTADLATGAVSVTHRGSVRFH
jgi:hypothetical protein